MTKIITPLGCRRVPDIVDRQTRSRMMAGIRSTNTRPERMIRSALHARGFRYRLHPRTLPGRPDIVLPRYRAAIFVHGCFWHGHNCGLFRLPGTRPEFWAEKIQRNRQRDAAVMNELVATGWRVLTIWECAIRLRRGKVPEPVIDEAISWLRSGEGNLEIRGNNGPD